MIDNNALAKAGRYSSGLLVTIFLINLLLDSQVVPFVDWDPFLGGVEQFILLLAASALITIEFMIASRRAESQATQEMETESHSETHVDATVES